jgi:hypothetical protein
MLMCAGRRPRAGCPAARGDAPTPAVALTLQHPPSPRHPPPLPPLPQGLCNPGLLLGQGLAPGLQAALWRATGLDAQGALWGAAAGAAALPAAAYAARAWVAAQLRIGEGAAAALARLERGGAAAEAARRAAGGRGAPWGLALLRAALVSTAAAAAARAAAAAVAGAAPPLAALVAGGAAAVGAIALAWLPAVLAAAGLLAPQAKQQQKQRQQQQQQQQHGSGGVAALSLGLEAAWGLAAAAAAAGAALSPWAPLAAGGAAAAAAALCGLHAALLAPAAAAAAAAAGDEALVHVRVRLDSSTAAFDDSRDTLRAGLRVRVGGRGADGGGPDAAAALPPPPPGRGPLAALGGVSGGLGPLALDAVAARPGSQWLPLVPLIEAALPGALLGETVRVPFFNGGTGASDPADLQARYSSLPRVLAPPGTGPEAPAVNAPPGVVPPAPLYRSRQLCWWQPLEEVKAKFGRAPEAGEAFLYPVNGDGAWLWTAVRAVGTEHVELDANFGTEGQTLVMEVEVVELVKRSGGGGSSSGGGGGGGGGAAVAAAPAAPGAAAG